MIHEDREGIRISEERRTNREEIDDVGVGEEREGFYEVDDGVDPFEGLACGLARVVAAIAGHSQTPE